MTTDTIDPTRVDTSTGSPDGPPLITPPFGPGHPLWLDDDQLEQLTPDELDAYEAILQAEFEGIGVPVEGGPGELANQIGSHDLHPRHLQLVDEAYMRLGRAADGDTTCKKKLLIVMPPQHGKSTRTRWGSLHWLKNRPEHRVLVASAEKGLARDHTRWVRAQVAADAAGPKRLGLELSRENRSASYWDINGHRGGMYAVGMGGALTGRPGDLLVLDDPVKRAKDVEKVEQRNAMWEWFTQVFMTRRSPDAVVVVIMTRWHKDDIAGRILASDEAGEWEVLHLPALCDDPATDLLGREQGAALWPSRYTVEWLLAQKKLLGSRGFAALYQGQPVPAGGTLLQRHWFRIEQDWPRAGVGIRFIDFAATAKDDAKGGDPDWTVAALVALHEGRWWILDVERWRESPHRQKQRLIALRQKDGPRIPVRCEQEPGSAGKLFVHDLATTVYVGYDFAAKPSTGSKILRSGPLQAAAEAGNVTLYDDGKSNWVNEFLDEAEEFPYGAHDDQIDGVAGAMEWIINPTGEEEVVQLGRWMQTPRRR